MSTAGVSPKVAVCLLLTLLLQCVHCQLYRPTPARVNITVGNNITIVCGLENRTMADKNDASYTVSWGIFRSAPRMSEWYGPGFGSFLGGRASVALDGTLTVLNVSKNDFNETWTCQISDQVTGLWDTIDTHITVRDPAGTMRPSMTSRTMAAGPTTTVTPPTTVPPTTSTLPIQGRPDQPPQKPHVEVLSDTTINVTWLVANVSRPIYRPTSYAIEVWKRYMSSVGSIRLVLSVDTRQKLVDILEPNTHYTVYVIATNPKGSRQSLAVHAKTLPEGQSATSQQPGTTIPGAAFGTGTGIFWPITTTAEPTASDTKSEATIFGLSTTLFAVIAGVGGGLVLCLLIATMLYCRKSKKLRKVKTEQAVSQLDMLHGDDAGSNYSSSWATPSRHRAMIGHTGPSPGHGSRYDLNGMPSQFSSANDVMQSTHSIATQLGNGGGMQGSNFASQFSSQQDICDDKFCTPQRKRKMPRPGGVPPLKSNEHDPNVWTQDPELDEEHMGIDVPQNMHQNNMNNGDPANPGQMTTIYTEVDMEQPEKLATDGYHLYPGAIQGIIVPPPPGRTPPPLQIGDYPHAIGSCGSYYDDTDGGLYDESPP